MFTPRAVWTTAPTRIAASPSRILAVDTSMRPRSRNWALMAALVDEPQVGTIEPLGCDHHTAERVASPTERVGLGDDVSNHRNGGIGVHRRWRCRTTAPGYHREHRNQANQRGQRATPHAVVLDFSSRRHIHPFDMQGTRRAYPSIRGVPRLHLTVELSQQIRSPTSSPPTLQMK